MTTNKFNQHKNALASIGDKAFSTLLLDKSTNMNLHILESNTWKEIPTNADEVSSLVIPRSCKPEETQNDRKNKHGEVFTPTEVVNHQLSKHDQKWFGSRDAFFVENTDMTFKPAKADFSGFAMQDLEMYISSLSIEYTCGEGPYTANRHDVTSNTYSVIHLQNRCGRFDRKMLVVNAITTTIDEWLEATRKALHSTYAYDYQGDSVLLTREALIMTVIDNFQHKFGTKPAIPRKVLEEFADIVSWNVFQMDALNDAVPFSPNTLSKIKYWVNGSEVIYADIRKMNTNNRNNQRHESL